jgi:hypothetical protein
MSHHAPLKSFLIVKKPDKFQEIMLSTSGIWEERKRLNIQIF